MASALQTVHRATHFQARPNQAQASALFALAGACRWTWNAMLDSHQACYAAWKDDPSKPKPSAGYNALTKELTGLRADTDWLAALPVTPLRSACKRLALAFDAFFDGRSRFPKRKTRHGSVPGFDWHDNPKVRDGRIWLGRGIGWVRLMRRGENRYADWKPVKATFEHVRCTGAWRVTVTYEGQAAAPTDNGLAVGVDRNAARCGGSDGRLRPMDVERLEKLEKGRRKWQRRAARRVGAKPGEASSNRRKRALNNAGRYGRKAANLRRQWAHETVNDLASLFGTVVLEKLDLRAMTRKGRGKRGLNRAILGGAMGILGWIAQYKAARVIHVPAHHTSQTCSSCGHVDAASRKGRRFRCTGCGFRWDADLNAAVNILARAIRLGLLDPPPDTAGGWRADPAAARDAPNGRGKFPSVRLGAPLGAPCVSGCGEQSPKEASSIDFPAALGRGKSN